MGLSAGSEQKEKKDLHSHSQQTQTQKNKELGLKTLSMSFCRILKAVPGSNIDRFVGNIGFYAVEKCGTLPQGSMYLYGMYLGCAGVPTFLLWVPCMYCIYA